MEHLNLQYANYRGYFLSLKKYQYQESAKTKNGNGEKVFLSYRNLRKR